LEESFGAAYDLFFIMGGDLWNEIKTPGTNGNWCSMSANHVVVKLGRILELFTNHVPEVFGTGSSTSGIAVSR